LTTRLRVLLSGGGTGGHVYPALTVVAAAQAAGRDLDFRYVGTSNGLERAIVGATPLVFDSIDAGAFRGRSPIAALSSLGHNLRGAVQAFRLIRHYRPDVILATGGFVCVPVVLAARALGVPTVVYLPDLRPGWAIRFLARFATAVAVSFEDVVPYVSASRVVVTGYPVRAELGSWSLTVARESLRIPADEPIVLVLGGSRGARSINDAMVAGATEVTSRAHVIHATGPTNFDSVSEKIGQLPAVVRERYRLYPYLNSELAPALAAASVVVARAGASVLGELPRVGAPGVLIPGTFAGGHQGINAAFLADRGAAIVVADDDLPRGGLLRVLLDLLDHPDRLRTMSERSRLLAYPRAALDLCDLVEEYGRQHAARAQPRRST
jgi:UDP-N-acetylglucosamine--N-acetylmuramyl-(pentapeptide) pyrophosphoryl-undecaprenol N-acetylglucosamine transferase